MRRYRVKTGVGLQAAKWALKGKVVLPVYRVT